MIFHSKTTSRKVNKIKYIQAMDIIYNELYIVLLLKNTKSESDLRDSMETPGDE